MKTRIVKEEGKRKFQVEGECVIYYRGKPVQPIKKIWVKLSIDFSPMQDLLLIPEDNLRLYYANLFKKSAIFDSLEAAKDFIDMNNESEEVINYPEI